MKKGLPTYRLNIFLLAFLLPAPQTHGQNLLANPSFELINYCCEYGSKCAPKGWFNTNLTGVNSTIFVERAVTDFGKRCIQLKLIDITRPQKRQYAFSPLLCKLEKDESYYFSVWVKSDHIAVKQLHVILDDSMHVQFEDRQIEAEPTITLTNKRKYIYDKKGKWIRLSAVYKANGTEKYLTIGYLTPGNEVEYKMIRKSAKVAYMSIDSINLVPVSKAASCDLEAAKRLFFLEQRRHIFDRPCGDSSFNMFPFLLKQPKDTAGSLSAAHRAILPDQGEETQTKIWRNLVFGFNQADLQPQSFPVIDSLIEDLMINPGLQMKITGHTDNFGTAEYNLTLSEQRAKAVADYMTGKGVNGKRITWSGMGDTQPVADNTTEAGRAVNRRVEFEFYVK